MTQDFPVDQIAGMQNRQTRNAGKRGCRHVKVIPYPYHIRIGIIGMQYRIPVCSVAVIGDPYPGKGPGLRGCLLPWILTAGT